MVWKIFSNNQENEKTKIEEKEINSQEIIENGESVEESTLDEDKKEKKFKPKKEEKVYVIPLGGLEEVGKNMTLIQYRDEIVVIDAGLSFPGEDLLGIDLVIPDFTYLENNKEKVKGVLITHGHEDHIGGISYLYKSINPETALYGSKLSLALAKAKFEKNDEKHAENMIEVKAREKVKIGKYFEIEFIRVTHSIADAFAMAIHTPVGIILHTGDFKIDLTPVDQNGVDFFKLSELGEKGVLLMMSDSTNAEVEGWTKSERSVGESLRQEFQRANGRIIVAAFASHIHRLQQIFDIAAECYRKVVVDGRSMAKVVEIASKLGYLRIPENTLLTSFKESEDLEDNEIVMVCTGTQGEPLSALSRIAKKMHKQIQIKEGDTVIISATPIPGNEKAVYANINNLLKNKAEVIYEKVAGIHVSGHGSQEELKMMLNLIKPKFFMPVHGEYKQLKRHKELAMEIGIPEEDIIITANGSKIEVTQSAIKIAGKVPAGVTLIDGIGIGDVGNIVIRDRQLLAQDGVVIIVLTISKEGKILAGPDIITRGFVYAREAEALIKETSERIKTELSKIESEKAKEWSLLKNTTKEIASEFLYERTKRNPIILPIVMEV